MSGENLELFDGNENAENLESVSSDALAQAAEIVLNSLGQSMSPELVENVYKHNTHMLIEPHQTTPVFEGVEFDTLEHKPFLFALKYDCLEFVKDYIESKNFNPFANDVFAQWVLYFAHEKSALNVLRYLENRFKSHIYLAYGLAYIRHLVCHRHHQALDGFKRHTFKAFRRHPEWLETHREAFDDALLSAAHAMYKFERENFKEGGELSVEEKADEYATMSLFRKTLRVFVREGANPFVDNARHFSLLYYAHRTGHAPQTHHLAVALLVDYANNTYKNRAIELKVPLFQYSDGQHTYPSVESESSALGNSDDVSSEGDEEKYSAFELSESYKPLRREEWKSYNLEKESSKKSAAKVNDEVLESLEKVVEKFPNFESAMEDIITHLHLSKFSNRPLKIEPLLMVGPPGIGKTEFSNELCKVLGLEKLTLSGPEMSANFTLSGMDRTWGGAKPGLIAQQLIQGSNINFIAYLDEIDKVIHSTSSGGDPLAALFGLMEETSAEKFNDQFYQQEVTFDASHISFLATGNSLETISAPIQSRFTLVNVEPPTKEQKRVIVNSIYQRLIEGNQLNKVVSSSVPETVIDYLTSFDPRQIRQMIKLGLGALLRSKKAQELTLECFPKRFTDQLDKHKARRIGFV